ncbi:ICE-like protease (caspase) p20 domain protein [Ceratobasidium sp. AG-Ba]|nr:ICE-like protease (caspase) p20 domain protein [Ceratobasidium sp. AG-Ba]
MEDTGTETIYRILDPLPVPGPRLFALIIGINHYPNINGLQGAVSDGKSMAEFLRQISVPNEHIAELYDECATRDAIIKEFRRLTHDDRIEFGDAIVIFYAGHGCEIDAPQGWEMGDYKIQALVPFDVKTLDGGKIVEVLPDITISSLIDDLANQKGDNITVIFDCCHSTGGTRGESSEVIARCVDSKDLPPLSSNVDEAILGQTSALGRSSAIPTGFAHRALRSHVLLAACGSNEVAWERDGRGEFTSALLSILGVPHLNQMSYSELMDSLPPMAQQSPQCEGLNKHRALFNNKTSGASPGMTRIEIANGIIKLHAGAAQGVTVGSRFEVYQHNSGNPSDPCLATLNVLETKPFYSVLENSSSLSHLRSPAYARQASASKGYQLQVYVSPVLHIKLQDDSDWETNLSTSSDFPARQVKNQSDADLSIDLTPDNQVSFFTHNKFLNKHGISKLSHTVSLNVQRVLDVLYSAANWNWHANRTNPNTPLEGSVRIEMIRVKEDLNVWNELGRRPLVECGDNLNESGVVDIEVEPADLYGYRIVNDSRWDLYPYLFYFDASKLSIEPYYLPPAPGAGGEVDIPLPRNSLLSIGYGASGEVPFAYCLDDEQMLDVGLIKLFVTSSPVELGLIEQESPFEQLDQRKVVVHSKSTRGETWATQVMALVQHNQLPEPLNPISRSLQVAGLKEDPIWENSFKPKLAELQRVLTTPSAPFAPLAYLNIIQENLGRHGVWPLSLLALMLSCILFVVFF